MSHDNQIYIGLISKELHGADDSLSEIDSSITDSIDRLQTLQEYLHEALDEVRSYLSSLEGIEEALGKVDDILGQAEDFNISV